ncbi:uncharacterized protein C19orf44 [Acipenser ruthenus]|uniref:uncharacterized protein C19orf44 n=1 Tax=Acipenser ruthenus TaxID=7906 RepID=UPI002741AAF8|nr:uncharacterized protein C19orf44 [Acipenser ruthenus]XP_058870887.1 uncharacterized protein C19orf44 [Acipenser ruthenus]
MWNRSDSRSSALARAQTQLRGKRVSSATNESKDEFQEYMDALTKKTNALKVSQTPFQDLSDLSMEDTDSEMKENRIVKSKTTHREDDREKTVVESRFLKKASQSVKGSQSPTMSKTSSKTNPTAPKAASTQRGSTSAALNRLALIENKIMNRRRARDHADPDADLWASDEKPFSVQSSSDHSTRGSSRFLKRKPPDSKGPDPAQVEQTAGGLQKSHPKLTRKQVTVDSDEEDMKKLLGSSAVMSEESFIKQERPASRESPAPARKSFLKSDRKTQPRSPSPPRRSPLSRTPSPRRSPLRTVSRTPSPPRGLSPRRMLSPRMKFIKRSSSSLSLRSDVKSVEELFPSVLESEGVISERSDGSDDFKLNIMTFEDLVPAILGETEAPEERQEKTKSSKTINTTDSKGPQGFSQPANLNQVDGTAEYESDFESEIQTVSEKTIGEISERLNDDSPASMVQEVSGRSQREAWSEQSGYSAEERARKREHTESDPSWSYPGRTEGGRSSTDSSYSRASTYSSPSPSGTLTPTPRKGRSSKHRAVKEAGVQTQATGLAYNWSNGMAVLGPSIGATYVDPTPIASHVVGADALEALTAYSPAVFALNDMLKQQLALTRQFAETSRYLHTSLLESLGPENYHYTTLEDTKEFIRNCKPPPLTMEEALEEVLQDMREYHYI